MITSDYDIKYQRWRVRAVWCVSVLFAMCWNMLPLTVVWQWIFPDALLLVCLFWTIKDDSPRSLITVCLLGLLMDLATGALLGLHAFGYVIVIFIAARFRKVLSSLPIWQQGFFVTLLVMANQCLQWVVLQYIGLSMSAWCLLSPWVAGYLIWPLLVVALQAGLSRRQY